MNIFVDMLYASKNHTFPTWFDKYINKSTVSNKKTQLLLYYILAKLMFIVSDAREIVL